MHFYTKDNRAENLKISVFWFLNWQNNRNINLSQEKNVSLKNPTQKCVSKLLKHFYYILAKITQNYCTNQFFSQHPEVFSKRA